MRCRCHLCREDAARPRGGPVTASERACLGGERDCHELDYAHGPPQHLSRRGGGVRACVAGIEITRIWKTLRKCQDFLRQLPTAVSADLKRSLSLHQEAVRASLKAEVAAQVRPCRMLILICVPSHVCVRGRARAGRDLTHVRMRRRCGLVGNALQFIGLLTRVECQF